ncbi:MAG: OmpL47-type beta-barrel domain-containing protein [Betaproteobacteria bacterium]
MRSRRLSVVIVAAAASAAILFGRRPVSPRLRAETYPPPILAITVNDAAGNDTHKLVLAPRGATCEPGAARSPVPRGRCPINIFGGLGVTSDEMQTIFSPGTLGTNADYLFWVASGTKLSDGIGAVVLSGGRGPNAAGWWTLAFAKQDGYGIYPQPTSGPCSGAGAQQPGCHEGVVLMPVVGGTCIDHNKTFDSSYAAPGTIVKDPSTPGRLLMIYEGANVCAGIPVGSNPSGNAYIVTAVATSTDYGRHWPLYVNPPNQQILPFHLTATPTPKAPDGMFGTQLCEGNCGRPNAPTPPFNYGRYPILSPNVSLGSLITQKLKTHGDIGDGEPSAFVDDVKPGSQPDLYVIHGYSWNDKVAGLYQIPDQRESDLMLAKAALTEDARLDFRKWYVPDGGTGGFTEAGSVLSANDADRRTDVGGLETPILPDGAYENCADRHQTRHMGSINYVEATQQYLLTFVCSSPSDPSRTTLEWGLSCNPSSPEDVQAGCGPGASWFYATSYDPSDPAQWSEPQPITGQTQPRQIDGSWSQFDPVNCTGNGFKGLYPTFMSPAHEPGHLGTTGYAFYMWGCEGGGESRLYSARQFRIITPDATPPSETASVSGPLGLNGWYIGGPVVVTFTATDDPLDPADIATVQWSVNGGRTWRSGTLTLYADGIHTVLYRATDVESNVQVEQSLQVDIDSTPPVTTASGQYLTLPNIGPVSFRVTLTARDNVSGVASTSYSLDGGVTWRNGTAFALGNGRHTVLFRSVDVAGNQEQTKSATFDVRLPPT